MDFETPRPTTDLPDRPPLDQEPEGGPAHGRIGYGRYARFTPVVLAVLMVVGLGLVGLARQGEETPAIAPPRIEHQEAPDAAVRLLDGSRVRLADLRGSVVVLNFWASWCAPCKVEAPMLQALHEEAVQTGERTVVVGVNVRQDQAEDARAFVRDFGLSYPIGRDDDTEQPGDGPVARAFGVALLPTTIFIGPDGVVERFHIGPLSETQLRFAVDEARSGSG